MKFTIIYIIILNLLFSYNELHYKIRYLGIYVADCIITNKDTLYNDQISQVVNFHVKSKKIINYFFPIKNNYRIILGKNNNILYFKKHTSQPNLTNYFETETRDDNIVYKNTNFEISSDYFNIFSLLHLLMMDKNKIPAKFKLEREGLLYDAQIIQKKKIYFLDLNLKKNNREKLIENTDIFTWALYMDGAKRKIYFSNDNKYIKKCIFSKGLISLSASLNSYK